MSELTPQQLQIQELKVKFLEYYSQLPVQKLAGASIGRDETTIIRWKAEDENFANQIEEAKAAWAIKMAKGVKSKEWLLERLMKDHFAQRQEITGKDGKDLPVPILKVQTNVHRNERDEKDQLTIETN